MYMYFSLSLSLYIYIYIYIYVYGHTCVYIYIYIVNNLLIAREIWFLILSYKYTNIASTENVTNINTNITTFKDFNNAENQRKYLLISVFLMCWFKYPGISFLFFFYLYIFELRWSKYLQYFPNTDCLGNLVDTEKEN